MAKAKIVLDVEVKDAKDIEKLKKSLAGLGKAGKGAVPGTDAAGKSISGMVGNIKNLVAGGLLAAAGQQLLAFGKASVNAASDVQETQSKFNAVFKDLAGDVTKELDTFAAAANRSTYDLQGFAATLQDTFVPLGFARDEAASTSIQLVKLAEDLASFNNLETADVVNDLQSAMVGNTETLRKYGIVASQAAIDQEALSLGLEFTKGKMDAQTKAAAILSITMKSTSDAQGDAIATADGYANVTKGMEAATLDLQVAIGNVLLPSMTETKVVLTGLISDLATYAKVTTDGADTVSEMAEANKNANLTHDELIAHLGGVNESLRLSRTFLGGFVSDQYEVRDSLLSTVSQLAASSGSYEDFEAAVKAAGLDINDLNSELQKAPTVYGNTTRSLYEVSGALEEVRTNTIAANVRAVAQAAAMQGVADSVGMTTDEIVEYSAALSESRGPNEDLNDKLAQQSSLLSDSEVRLAASAAGQAAFAESAAAAALELEKESAAAEAAAEAAAQLLVESGDLFTSFMEGAPAIDASGASLMAMADAGGASAEQLALLALATGELSEAEANALIQQVALEQSLAALGAQYADGTLNIDQYVAAAEKAVAEVSELTVTSEAAKIESANLGAAAFEAAHAMTIESGKAQNLVEELIKIPSDIKSSVKVDGLDDAIGKSRALDQALRQIAAGGGEIAAGSAVVKGNNIGAATGLDNFVVPPGYPNDSFSMGLTSGEVVNVIPPGGNTINSNNNSNSLSFNIAAGGSQQQAQDIMGELRSSGLRGF